MFTDNLSSETFSSLKVKSDTPLLEFILAISSSFSYLKVKSPVELGREVAKFTTLLNLCNFLKVSPNYIFSDLLTFEELINASEKLKLVKKILFNVITLTIFIFFKFIIH